MRETRHGRIDRGGGHGIDYHEQSHPRSLWQQTFERPLALDFYVPMGLQWAKAQPSKRKSDTEAQEPDPTA